MSLSDEKYILSFTECPGYLYAKVTAASIDREIAMGYLRAVADKCREINCDKVVLERDIPAMLTDADLFFTTNDFLNMMRGIRVAFINPHEQIDDEMGFAVMIGTNRGANFSLHGSIASAERWLLDQ